MTCLREQLELIEKCEVGIMEAERHIRDKAIDAIATVRRREKQLVAEIRETIGEKTLHFLSEKETLRENLKNIETTFKMTAVILKGTSIELLMARKEMHEKMNDIVLLNVESTPENLRRDIRLCTDFPEFSTTVETKHANNNNDRTAPMNTVNRAVGIDVEVQTYTVQFGKDADVQTNLIDSGRNVDSQTDLIEVVSVATAIDDDFNINESKTREIKESDFEKIKNPLATTELLSLQPYETTTDGTANVFTSSEKEVVEPGTPVRLIHPVEYVTPFSMEEIINDDNNHVNQNQESDTAARLSTSSQGPDSMQQIQVPVSPLAVNNAQKSVPVSNTKTNVANNWMNNCRRRSSVTSSFENIPLNSGSGAVRMLKGLLRMPDNTFGNSTGSDDCFESVTSPTLTRPFKTAFPPRTPVMVTTGTAMDHVILNDFGTSMSYVSYIDKETSTPHILQTNKAVSTENQEMVDKGTSTVVDVTAAYRNLTTCRRLVTVSRGTCTPRTMYPLDRATSPVLWPGLQVNHSEVEYVVSNSPGIQISVLEIPM